MSRIVQACKTNSGNSSERALVDATAKYLNKRGKIDISNYRESTAGLALITEAKPAYGIN